jgi:hypothetical protein
MQQATARSVDAIAAIQQTIRNIRRLQQLT